VLANKLPGGKIELLGNAYLLGRGQDPVFQHRIETTAAQVRTSSHRMTDAILGALTGRPGGFASHLVYSGRVASNRQVFGIDADGFNLHTESPDVDTSIAPAFGPKGEVYYAWSRDMSPFQLARGKSASVVPLSVPGSIFGLAFSPDHGKIAVSVAHEGATKIYVGNADGTGLSSVSTAPLANHPVFGPGGKMAYVGGGTAGQRVYVDGKAISPAGFNASAPVFCDTPGGLVVVFTVGVGAGADLVSTDTRGGSITRITQNQGANSYPACSPDGRLLAFFSTRKSDKGPGLYVVPINAVWRAKRISTEVGESLRWEALPPQ
jgi:TolB protein